MYQGSGQGFNAGQYQQGAYPGYQQPGYQGNPANLSNPTAYPGPNAGPYPGANPGPYPGANPGANPGPYAGAGGNQGPYAGAGGNQGPYAGPGSNAGGFAGGNQGYQPAGVVNPGYPGGVTPEVQQWFNSVDTDKSGRINCKELQAALVNGQGKNFSEECTQLMIGLFDPERTGTIDVVNFGRLFNYVNQWLTVFRMYDRDGSGLIEEAELAQAFTQMGFRFSQSFVQFVINKSDRVNHRQISVDQFIAICIQLQRFTEEFRIRDREQKGSITIGFEDFLTVVLRCAN